MKKQILIILALCAVSFPSFSAAPGDGYNYIIDLTRSDDDKLMVTLITPEINNSEITFYLPKIIPGTYMEADYGRFVSNLQAFDKKGKELVVERLDDNSWSIQKANKMVKLTYMVDDTFDTKLEGAQIYPMAGTNIDDGKNFVLNTSGFFGYFEGMKEMPFDLTIIRPENFYGSTGLIPVYNTDLNVSLEKEMLTLVGEGSEVDRFSTENYNYLIDSPIMYCVPDTTVIDVAGTEVLISVYSPNKLVTSEYVAENIKEILFAQRDYLGGDLPVDKYAFIFYCEDMSKLLPIQGALEHSYSSFYYFPDMQQEALLQGIRDAAAHEFFHIITPLNIHSEEIQYFDFNEPKMSEHLWLYEGMTEYFAGNVQVKYDIISEDEYLDVLSQKMTVASQNFNDTLSFTDLSKYTLTEHGSQYTNVYFKGALNGMCMDIMLLDLSDGKYGVQELLANLAEKYGKDQPFKDAELFDEIESLTYPELRTYLNTYIVKGAVLPYKEVMEKVGVEYVESLETKDYSLGQIGIGYDPSSGSLYISSVANMNDFGKALGYKQGDVILKLNGIPLPENVAELQAFFENARANMKEGETFTVTVKRIGDSEEEEEVVLSSEIFKTGTTQMHVIKFIESPTEEQLMLRKAWLKPRG